MWDINSYFLNLIYSSLFSFMKALISIATTMFLVSMIVLGLVSGCTHKPVLYPTGLLPATFWQDQIARKNEFMRIEGKLSLHYEGSKESVSGSGRIVAEFPKKLRIELRDLLGRLQYLALLSGKELKVYYPSKKKLYIDRTSGLSYLKYFLGFQLSFSDLHHLFLGILPVPTSSEVKAWKWNSSGSCYEGEVNYLSRKYKICVDGKHAGLVQVKIEDLGQEIEVRYSDFKNNWLSSSSGATAEEIEIRHLNSGSLVTLDWKSLKPLTSEIKAQTLQFEAPHGTNTQYLD